jgi:hypothetical protein
VHAPLYPIQRAGHEIAQAEYAKNFKNFHAFLLPREKSGDFSRSLQSYFRAHALSLGFYHPFLDPERFFHLPPPAVNVL